MASGEIYLVRHAIAEERASSGRDADRALTRSGREKMQKAARGLARLEVAPSLILSSPLVRARETAEIVAQELGGLEVEEEGTLAPGIDHGGVARLLGRRLHGGGVMVVGHEPDMSELLSYLVSGTLEVRIRFRKGAVACLTTDGPPVESNAVLEWMMSTGQLGLI